MAVTESFINRHPRSLQVSLKNSDSRRGSHRPMLKYASHGNGARYTASSEQERLAMYSGRNDYFVAVECIG
jgi:hypothetical protein